MFKPFFVNYRQAKAEKLLAVQERQKKLLKIEGDCECIDRSKMPPQNDSYTVSVYGNYLYGISVNQTRSWEQRREAVEWVRAKLNSKSVVYYELSNLNILVIAEIGRILGEGKLHVFCKENECDWIQRQKQFENIGSISLVRASVLDIATKSDAIITDNE